MTLTGIDGKITGIKPDYGQAPTKGRVYVAGPMTGIPQFNFPAFDQAADMLRKHGYDVVSPAEMDDPETRKAALASPDGAPGTGSSSGETWEDFLRRDIDIVRNVDGIVVLPGWENSKGATFEVDTANKLACWVRPYDPESGKVGPPFSRKELAEKCMRKWADVWGLSGAFKRETLGVDILRNTVL